MADALFGLRLVDDDLPEGAARMTKPNSGAYVLEVQCASAPEMLSLALARGVAMFAWLTRMVTPEIGSDERFVAALLIPAEALRAVQELSDLEIAEMYVVDLAVVALAWRACGRQKSGEQPLVRLPRAMTGR